MSLISGVVVSVLFGAVAAFIVGGAMALRISRACGQERGPREDHNPHMGSCFLDLADDGPFANQHSSCACGSLIGAVIGGVVSGLVAYHLPPVAYVCTGAAVLLLSGRCLYFLGLDTARFAAYLYPLVVGLSKVEVKTSQTNQT